MKNVFLRSTDAWISISLFILVCLLFIKFLFATDISIYKYDINYFYPHEKIIRASLAEDGFPLWNPYFGGGSPQLSKIQAGLLYPPSVLLRTFLPIVPMFNWDAILHVYLAGLGMFWLLRDLQATRFMAFICALAFMFSGAIMPRIYAGHVSVVHSLVWVSWLLLAYRYLLRKPSWVNILVTVLFTSLVILGGHPQISIAVLFVPVSFFFFVYLPQRVRLKEWQQLGKGLLASTTVALLTVGLLAVQLLPFLTWLGQTSRGQGDYIETLDYMLRHSFNVEHMLTLFLPHIWGDVNLTRYTLWWEVAPFVSVMLLVLLFIGFVTAKEKKKPLALYFAGLALFGLIMSVGHVNPIYPFLFKVAPIFRGPGRMLVLWPFAVTVLAGIYGSDVPAMVAKGEQKLKLRKIVYGATGILLLSFIMLMVWSLIDTAVISYLSDRKQQDLTSLSISVPNSLLTFSLTMVFITSLLWITQQKEIHMVRWQGLLWGIVLAEMLLFALPLLIPYPAAYLYARQHPYAQLDLDKSQVRFDGYREPPNYLLPTVKHVKNGEEYFALEHLAAAGQEGQNLLSAGYMALSEPANDPQYKLVQQKGSAYLYEHAHNLPRIYAAPAIEVVSSHEAALAGVMAPAFKATERAVVTILDSESEEIKRPTLPPQSAVSLNYSARYLAYGHNSFTAKVETNSPAMVIFSEMDYPGWEATINGRPVPIWRVNYAFRGVVVDAGTHRIEMTFNPRDFQIGLAITLITIIMLVFITAVNWIIKQRTYLHQKAGVLIRYKLAKNGIAALFLETSMPPESLS